VAELRLPDVNRVLLSGRLTRDPDRRYAADGTAVTRFDLAFHRHVRGRNGRVNETTGFVSVISYQRLAEVCAESLRKGSAVLIEGRLAMREWTSPQGEKRSRLELVAESVHFLEQRPETTPAGEARGGASF